MFRGLLHIESHAAGRENEIGNMVPQTCIKVFFQASPEFLEEIGLMNTVPSGDPITMLARAKEYFRQQQKQHIAKLQLKRRRFCILYYDAGDPCAYDGQISAGKSLLATS